MVFVLTAATDGVNAPDGSMFMIIVLAPATNDVNSSAGELTASRPWLWCLQLQQMK